MPTLFEEIRPLLMDYEELERRCIDCADGHTQTQGFLMMATDMSLEIFILPRAEARTVQEAFVTLLTQAICAGWGMDVDWWDRYYGGEFADDTFRRYLLDYLGPEMEASFVRQNQENLTGTLLNAKEMLRLLPGGKDIVENLCQCHQLAILLQNNQWGKLRPSPDALQRNSLRLRRPSWIAGRSR